MSKGNDGVVKPEDRAGMCDLCRCAFVTGVIVVNNDTEQINIFLKKKESKWLQCTTVKSNLVYQKCTQVQLLQVTAPKGVTLTSVCQMALTVASPYLAR